MRVRILDDLTRKLAELAQQRPDNRPPDIHLFADLSGSVEVRHHADALFDAVTEASEAGVDVYLTTFSHYVGATTLLASPRPGLRAAWQALDALPKASGGTDFRRVWEHILASPARMDRLSVILTDFEWLAPREQVPHPSNLFYAPCGKENYVRLHAAALELADSMEHITPALEQRIFGMGF